MLLFKSLLNSLLENLNNLVWYGRNWRLLKAGVLVYSRYLFSNPYTMCRLHMASYPEHQVQKIYGETAFQTLAKISEAAQLSPQDRVYDLGCGRGLGVFWWAAVVGCKTLGVDLNPSFIRRAQGIQKRVGLAQAEFIQGSIFDLNLSDATFIYLYGSAFTDEAVEGLVAHFRHLPAGVKIASISYPLSEYAEPGEYTLIDELPVTFLWGDTIAYIQSKN